MVSFTLVLVVLALASSSLAQFYSPGFGYDPYMSSYGGMYGLGNLGNLMGGYGAMNPYLGGLGYGAMNPGMYGGLGMSPYGYGGLGTSPYGFGGMSPYGGYGMSPYGLPQQGQSSSQASATSNSGNQPSFGRK